MYRGQPSRVIDESTSFVKAINGWVTFAVCTSSNNLNRERGVVQLLPGAAPRQCYFVIKVPDNTKGVAVHCSRVAVGNSAILDVSVSLGKPSKY